MIEIWTKPMPILETKCGIICFLRLVVQILLNMKSQSIAYLLNESERVYWILDMEDEVYSIWVMWTVNLQKCKDNFSFQCQAEHATIFGQNLKSLDFFCGGGSEVPNHGPQLISTFPEIRRRRYVFRHANC
jgi:hypothetical protein